VHNIEKIGEKKICQYRGGTLSLYEMSEVINVAQLPLKKKQDILIFKIRGREIGLMVNPPFETLEVEHDPDETTFKQPGISGSMIIKNKTTLLLDIYEFIKKINPEWFNE
jgi:two-component system chemotaxis sensor kinase CheA